MIPRKTLPLVLRVVPVLALAACADGPTSPDSGSALKPITPWIVMFDDTVSNADSVSTRLVRDVPSLRANAGSVVPGVSARIVDTESPMEVLHDVNGAVVRATADEAAALRAQPGVAIVEPVQTMQAAATVTTSSWALDRIDQSLLPLNGTATRFGNDGAGVRVAIFDTGIRWTHNDLLGRVAGGYNAFTATAKASGDGHGHGTFVASLAAGKTFGTAPAATLLDVQVLNAQGSGTSVELTRGVDWVIAEKKRVAGPMVANMSLGFRGGSPLVDALVDKLRAAGIVVVVAAGNESADACTVSPARAPGAITVGALARNTITDTRASFSNFGTCVDISAPGDQVIGAGAGSDVAGVMGSGTSMASPLVAGAVATYLGVLKTATPDAAASWINSEATTGTISNLPAGTPNRLLTLRRLPGTNTTPTTPTAPTTPTTPTTPPTTTTTSPTGTTVTSPTMSVTSACVSRTCTLTGTVPVGVSAADAPTLTWTWTYGNVATMTGTNLTRQNVSFAGAGSIGVTVTVRKGTTVVGTVSTTLTVQ